MLLAKPLRAFMTTEVGSAVLLLTVTVVALIWANSPLSESYESLWSTQLAIRIGDALLAMDLGHWINDGLMELFFFVIGLEVRRECPWGSSTLATGSLCPPSRRSAAWSCPRCCTWRPTPRGRPRTAGAW